jgi:hypothetical protein
MFEPIKALIFPQNTAGTPREHRENTARIPREYREKTIGTPSEHRRKTVGKPWETFQRSSACFTGRNGEFLIYFIAK